MCTPASAKVSISLYAFIPALNKVKATAAPSPAQPVMFKRSGAESPKASNASSAPVSSETCPAKQYLRTSGQSSAAFAAALQVLCHQA